MGKRELVALLNLSSWCLVMVERLFLAVPWGCLPFVNVVFPNHTHLLFLTVFNTPFGRYKFLRMPFGLSSSPEVWQRNLCQPYENVGGCAGIADDILLWGSDIEEHNKSLRAMLQKARDSNLKLHRSKLKIWLPEESYVMSFTKQGLKASESHVEAISQMDELQDNTELMRFNGMINYLGKYMSNLSSLN